MFQLLTLGLVLLLGCCLSVIVIGSFEVTPMIAKPVAAAVAAVKGWL